MSPDARRALDAVESRIAEACARSGRARGDVRIVAVSKTHPAHRIRDLIDHGHSLFGENRVQEAEVKIAEVGPGARWHLIGHLQRNKARRAVGLFELIHSVDSPDLLREIDHRAAAADLCQPVLLEVNLALEPSKSGVGENELGPLVDVAAELAHVDLQGLMTIPPLEADPEASRPRFARLRELLGQASARVGRPLPHLSMGMSADFEVAVEEGATLVRVGTAIFGARS